MSASQHGFLVDEEDAYNAGGIARTEGYSRKSCPHLHLSRLGSYWLCGWHDTDIERKQIPVTIKRRRQRNEE